MQTVDAIGTLSKQLVVYRAIIDENGRHTDETVDTPEAIKNRRTRRIGAVTEHGRAWAELGSLFADLMEVALAVGDKPRVLEEVVGRQQEALAPIYEELRRKGRARGS